MAAVGLAGLVGCAVVYVSDTTGTEALRLVSAGATLVDVRSVEEYEDGHIGGAVNIPVDDLAARVQEIPADRPVVLYCRSGRRASRAAEMLRAAGYADVHNLGPMGSWPEPVACAAAEVQLPDGSCAGSRSSSGG
jgi:phage shock protein E